MKRAARWQKLTGFTLALGGAMYAVHSSPPSASAIVIGGVVPLFVTFVTGNVAAKKVAANADPAP